MRRLLLFSLLLTACPRAPGVPSDARRGLDPALTSALQLPPGSAAASALQRLEQEAAAGSCPASWLRLRYVIDLFDLARLWPELTTGASRPGHALLWSALRLPGAPGRGRLATWLVFDALDKLLAKERPGCRGLPELVSAARLLRTDRLARSGPPEALAIAMAYKMLARSSSELAPNAQLRLVDWCARAFRLAAGGPPAEQHLRLAQCLFPLFDADPAPYFSGSAADRPTDPPWTLLARKLRELRQPLRRSRFAVLAAELERVDESFLGAAAPLLPVPLDLSRDRPPVSTAGLPWDRTELVQLSARGFLVGGRPILSDQDDALPTILGERLRNDLRRRVAVVARPEVTVELLLALARGAARAGVTTLELGVSRAIARRAPAGEAHAALGSGPVHRLEVIPVSTRLFGDRAGRGPRRDLPQRLEYEALDAESQLALGFGPAGSCRVASRDGTLRVPRDQVRAALMELARAYPEEPSLVLVPDAGVSFGQLVQMAALARGPTDHPLFPGLALASPGRQVWPEQDLRPTLDLLASVRVVLEPASSTAASRLAACYRAMLRERAGRGQPPLQGTLAVVRRGGRARVAGGSLRDGGLRRCIAATVGSEGPERLTVRFSLTR